jgi:signal recognition particle subunit SRP54
MFQSLTDRIASALSKMARQGRLTEENVDSGLREIRLALLEADVNLNVVKDLMARVRERAVGQDVLATVSPGQMLTKVVYDELVDTLGGRDYDPKFHFGTGQTVLMLAGLQGSGKTTTAAKIALRLKTEGKRPLLVADDLTRPGAVEQLKVLGAQIGVEVFHSAGLDAVALAKAGVAYAAKQGLTPVIIDTAGRLSIDEALMDELARVKAAVKPQEVLLVVDALTGQDAVETARRFDERLDLTGLVLTKFDGDARGGAALSMRAVTGKPVRMVGMGEKVEAIEWFHPERVAGRILGQGDVVSFVERAAENLDLDEAAAFEKKLRKQKSMDLDDFLSALRQTRKMGSMRQMLGFIPGVKISDEQVAAGELELRRFESIVHSMTREERRDPRVLDARRRLRIARGSGTSVPDINRFITQFREMQNMTSKLMGMGALGGGAAGGGAGGGMGHAGGGGSATKAKHVPKRKQKKRK